MSNRNAIYAREQLPFENQEQAVQNAKETEKPKAKQDDPKCRQLYRFRNAKADSIKNDPIR